MFLEVRFAVYKLSMLPLIVTTMMDKTSVA